MDIGVYLGEAIKHHSTNRLEDAERLYNAILSHYIYEPNSWHLLGMIAKNRGDYSKAYRYIKRAISIAPDISSFYWNLFSISNFIQPDNTAPHILFRYINILNQTEGSYLDAARNARIAGKNDMAMSILSKAINIYPENAVNYTEAVITLKKMGLDKDIESYANKAKYYGKRSLFKDAVNSVLIETFSYCNRVCHYCPNSINDRRSVNTHMNVDVYDKILRDLSEIKYDKNVIFQGYNEPLSDRSILEAIRKARRMLPNAKLMLSTSGDYLDGEYLEELHSAGLNLVHVSLHLQAGEKYQDSRAFKRLEQIEKAVGISANMKEYNYKKSIYLTMKYKDMEINLYGIDWSLHGTNRGGLLGNSGAIMHEERKAPCYLPVTMFTVYYNGNVTPCCQIVGDNTNHKQYVIGNVAEYETIFDMYVSRSLFAWREDLLSNNTKAPPCNYCSYGMELDDPDRETKIKNYRQTIGFFSEALGGF